MLFQICFIGAFALPLAVGEDLQKTKVFIIPVEPSLFNWTNGFTPNGYWYRASLLDSPDLAPWISYQFSKRHHKGFLYGVPPVDANNIQVEVIGLNRENYETRRAVISLNVTEKLDPAEYEIRLKIDNLNVEDMFDPHRLFTLLRIFTTVLWPESSDNLYMTFLMSAVKLGARFPLSPNDGEGVVIHLGSASKFSDTLEHLEQEVFPLRKLTSCPRDFKRSSVDRHFRPNGFIVDWCSFKLLKLKRSGLSDKSQFQGPSPLDYGHIDSADLVRIEEIPSRDYSVEFMATLVVPVVSLVALAAFLTVILCLHHENGHTEKPEPEVVEDPIQRVQCTLRENVESSPRLSEREDSCRPSPPPYTATKRFVFDS